MAVNPRSDLESVLRATNGALGVTREG